MAKVGITMLKLNNGYGKGRRKGNLKAVACEALEERCCSDEDYNPALTVDNTYEGITSGEELTRVITEEAEEYSRKQKENVGRSLRKDAIIGYACIVKPDSDFINGLDEEEEERFWENSNEIMRDILGERSIKSRVRHTDEYADHEHYFGMPYTKNGKLCGKDFFSLKLYKKFNEEYPRRMRAMGWDIEDCTVYDTETAESDPEYKSRHIAKKKEKPHGESSAKYKQRKKDEEIAELKRQNQEDREFYRQIIAKKDEEIKSIRDTCEFVVGQRNNEIRKLRNKIADMEKNTPKTPENVPKPNVMDNRYNKTGYVLNASEAPQTSYDGYSR